MYFKHKTIFPSQEVSPGLLFHGKLPSFLNLPTKSSILPSSGINFYQSASSRNVPLKRLKILASMQYSAPQCVYRRLIPEKKMVSVFEPKIICISNVNKTVCEIFLKCCFDMLFLFYFCLVFLLFSYNVLFLYYCSFNMR